jgi:hypothetical protein
MKNCFGILLALALLLSCRQSVAPSASEEPRNAPAAQRSIPAIDPNAPYEPREGDLVFQSLYHNPLIDAIEGSSDSPFSHCGIIHKYDESTWVVIEAIGPVRETVFRSWILQGRDRRYAVFRLKEPYRTHIPALVKAAKVYEGRPYDIHYDLDDAAIYCSELIYKAYLAVTGKELGRLQTLGDLRWQPHAQVIKQIEGGNVPLERKMITPRSLSEAPELEKIFTNYPAES